MKILYIIVLLLSGFIVKNAYGAEDWVFIVRTPTDSIDIYYDAKSIKNDSGILSGPTSKVDIRSVYPGNHHLKEELSAMKFYCKRKSFLILKTKNVYRNGGIENITVKSIVRPVNPNTLSEILFNIICD